MNNRIQRYGQISTTLACLSDRQLAHLLSTAETAHSGIGGKSLLLEIDGLPVFVKRVPLTDLERQPENFLSTANLFQLPLFCQYGIGSPGFGAWRELVAHIMTTNWVLSGECPSFPVLYHWRILASSQPDPVNIEEWGSLDECVRYWENSTSLRKRIEEVNSASHGIFLFLEYVPGTLYSWLSSQLSAGESSAGAAIRFVEDNLRTTVDYMNSRDFLHFDAHFENILTDGKLIYLSDFGLASSLKFDLSQDEMEFFNSHKNYDRCVTAVSLLHSIITSLNGKEKWQDALRAYLSGKRCEPAPALASAIKRYAPVALTLDEFYQRLKKVTKTTAYPAAELERLLNRC
jgi:hypothetical protein